MYLLKDIAYKNIINIKNLEIDAYKITAIVGKSGTGKTTLLKMFNKMITPDRGEIYYEGKNLEKLDTIEIRRSIVMLPQNPIVFDGDIKSNLLIGLKFSKKKLAEEHELNEMLKKIGLNKPLNDPTNKLSGGEKQRLALGRILLMDPEVLLLDEPSSALDDETEEQIIKMIVDYVKTNNKTLIMITHSSKIAQKYGDDLINIGDDNNG